MSGIAFSKLLPGGNATIILMDSSFDPEELSVVSAALMHPLHLHAEQVGALHGDAPIPHLQMMGGEFCVNATRSAALLLARAGKLRQAGDCLYGRITVSGMASPVHVLVSREEELLARLLNRLVSGQARLEDLVREGQPGTAESIPPSLEDGNAALGKETRLYCAARMDCGAGSTRHVDIAPGVCLMHLPGISHLLVDAQSHPMPAQWRKATAEWRSRAGLSNAPASGVVWYERQDDSYRIWPAVEVKATASEHMETACGSASMAMALMRQVAQAASVFPEGRDDMNGLETPLPSSSRTGDGPEPLAVIQPSGEILTVTLQYARADGGSGQETLPAHAWVSGKVSLLAEGLTYI